MLESEMSCPAIVFPPKATQLSVTIEWLCSDTGQRCSSQCMWNARCGSLDAMVRVSEGWSAIGLLLGNSAAYRLRLLLYDGFRDVWAFLP